MAMVLEFDMKVRVSILSEGSSVIVLWQRSVFETVMLMSSALVPPGMLYADPGPERQLLQATSKLFGSTEKTPSAWLWDCWSGFEG